MIPMKPMTEPMIEPMKSLLTRHGHKFLDVKSQAIDANWLTAGSRVIHTMWIRKILKRIQLKAMLVPAKKSRYPRLLRFPAGRNSAGPPRCRRQRRRPFLKASALSATTEVVPHRESSCCGQAGIGDPSRLHIATCRLDTVRHQRRRSAGWTKPKPRTTTPRPPWPRRRPPRPLLRRPPLGRRQVPLAQQSSYFCLKNDFDSRGSRADSTPTMTTSCRSSSNRRRTLRYRRGRWTNWPATC